MIVVIARLSAFWKGTFVLIKMMRFATNNASYSLFVVYRTSMGRLIEVINQVVCNLVISEDNVIDAQLEKV